MSQKATSQELLQHLDDLVAALLENRDTVFRNHIEWLFHHDVLPEKFPDPEYDDPLRYALAACIIERMVDVWIMPPHHQPSSVPAWCEGVPSLEKPFLLIPEELVTFRLNPTFLKRNILVLAGFMAFV
jgi:hypothetical protein